MGKIYITRHGETEWNTVKRMQGHCNSPLTPFGVEQAKKLGERLKNHSIDYIYTSSLGRAIQTATYIRGERTIEIIPTDELREIYLGSWQGRLASDVELEYPKQYRDFWEDPVHYVPVDGEAFGALSSRVSNFLDTLLKQHPDENVLIVSHAVVLKTLFNYIQTQGDLKHLWEGPPMKPTCLTVYDYHSGKLTAEIMGDISHYEEKNVTGGWFDHED